MMSVASATPSVEALCSRTVLQVLNAFTQTAAVLKGITVLAVAILKDWQYASNLSVVCALAPPAPTSWLLIVLITAQRAFTSTSFQIAILAEGAVAAVCLGVIPAAPLVV